MNQSLTTSPPEPLRPTRYGVLIRKYAIYSHLLTISASTGNTEEDSDTPKAPVKTVDKTSTHTIKRNADGLAPASKAAGAPATRRGGAASGNDGGM